MIMEEVSEDGSIQALLGKLFEQNHGLNIENEADVTLYSPISWFNGIYCS